MSKPLLPSQALSVLLQHLEPLKDTSRDEVIELDAASARRIYLTIDQIRRQTKLLEHEVLTHRLGEAAEKGREMVNELALAQFEALIVDPAGKIVRPDFRRGKP